MTRLLLCCALLLALLPSAAGAAEGRVKRPPTALWNAYPLVQKPDPVTRVPASSTVAPPLPAEQVSSGGTSSPSQPSIAVTAAAVTFIASALAVFAFMTMQTVPASGRRETPPRQEPQVDPTPRSVQEDNEPPLPELELPIEAEPDRPPENKKLKLTAAERDVEVLKAKRSDREDDHAVLMAKLNR
jgi:hypothetical protein